MRIFDTVIDCLCAIGYRVISIFVIVIVIIHVVLHILIIILNKILTILTNVTVY